MSEPHPLDGAKLKLDRSELDRELLKAQIEAFYRREPPRVVNRRDPQTGRWTPSDEGGPLPATWSTIVGNSLQNLRSALDHMAQALARRVSPRPNQFVAFPVVSDANKWHQSSGHLRRGVTPSAARLLRSMQPFATNPAAPASAPLAVLNELARIDRHRTLHLLVTVQMGMASRFGPVPLTGNVIDDVMLGPVGGTPVETVDAEGNSTVVHLPQVPARLGEHWLATPAIREPIGVTGVDGVTRPSTDMFSYTSFVLDVAFDHGTQPVPGHSVLGVLASLHDHISHDVLPRLAGLFEPRWPNPYA